MKGRGARIPVSEGLLIGCFDLVVVADSCIWYILV